MTNNKKRIQENRITLGHMMPQILFYFQRKGSQKYLEETLKEKLKKKVLICGVEVHFKF